MARIILDTTLSKQKTVVERTIGVTLKTPGHVPETEYEAEVHRQVATYIDGVFDDSHELPIPATPEDGGFERKVTLKVLEILQSNVVLTLDDGTQFPVKYLPEIISKGCDYIADKRREERRLAAGGE